MKQQNTQFKILSKGHVGLFSSMVLCATMSFAAPVSTALPSLNNVASGTVGINTTGTTMNIDQASQKSVINWNSYNIGSSATVNYNFAQSGSSSLNRVMSNNPSEIYGRLNANGQVILMNPNGVIFGNGSAINVGGLVATTLNMKDTDYLNGKMIFSRDNATGTITNNATLTAQEKGFIALLSPTVVNNGVIRATMGSVSLAGGDKIELSLDSTGLKTIIVEPSTIKTLIENKSLVEANGGMIYMGAKEAQALLDGAMNIKNSGTLQANTLNDLLGIITLDGHGIEVSGTVQALDGQVYVGNKDVEKTLVTRGAILSGEFVETSGKSLKVEDGVTIQAKHWLLDPTNLTIAASGGDISGATLSSNLGSGDVTLQADNNIYVNDAVAWSANKLTLTAGNDININAVMDVTGTAGLKLNVTPIHIKMGIDTTNELFNGKVNLATGTTFEDATGSYTVIGKTDATNAANITALQGVKNNISGKYVLGSDITGIGSWNSYIIGTSASPFSGIFNGLGHTLSGMTFSGSSNYVGLFGMTYTGTSQAQRVVLSNVGLIDTKIDITANIAGALVGNAFNTDIQNSFVKSSNDTNYYIKGGTMIGGLIGWYQSNDAVTVNKTDTYKLSNLYANIKVSGMAETGGLIGQVQPNSNVNTTIFDNLIAKGDVSYVGAGTLGSPYNFGGLLGKVDGTQLVLTNSHATGNVTGVMAAYGYSSSAALGGLIGHWQVIKCSTIDTVYATGNVSGGTGGMGGLIGDIATGDGFTIYISNAYATGGVSFSSNMGYAGGLIGDARNTVLTNTYATGAMTSTLSTTTTGIDAIGGLVGRLISTPLSTSKIQNSYSTSAITFNRPSYISVGGLVGQMSAGNTQILSSYYDGTISSASTSAITYRTNIGGLVGIMQDTATSNRVISNSYATGSISLANSIAAISTTYNRNGTFLGGLVGFDYIESYTTGKGLDITNSFASMTMTTSGTNGNTNAKKGGLIGYYYTDAESTTSATKLTLTNSFYDTTKFSGNAIGVHKALTATSTGATQPVTTTAANASTQKTTVELETDGTFSAFDTTAIWDTSGNSFPTLRARASDRCPSCSNPNGLLQLSAVLPASTTVEGTFASILNATSFSSGTPVLGTDYRIILKNAAGTVIYNSDTYANNTLALAALNALSPADYTMSIESKDPATVIVASSVTVRVTPTAPATIIPALPTLTKNVAGFTDVAQLLPTAFTGTSNTPVLGTDYRLKIFAPGADTTSATPLYDSGDMTKNSLATLNALTTQNGYQLQITDIGGRYDFTPVTSTINIVTGAPEVIAGGADLSKGATAGTVVINNAPTPPAGTTLKWAFADTAIDSYPIANSTNAPTSGLTTYATNAELPIVTPGKWLRLYEVDNATGKVVAYNERTVPADVISTPTFQNDVVAKGTAGDSTKVTGLDKVAAPNTFAWVLADSSLPTPDMGTTPESGLTAYANGANIPAVTVGKYLRLYELDPNGNVVKFEEKTLTAPQIKTPDFAGETLAKGSTAGSTVISGVTPKDPANTLKWVTSPTHLDEPSIGTAMIESGTTYTDGTTVPNVKVGQFLRLYEVDPSGNIVSFEERTLTAADIKAMALNNDTVTTSVNTLAKVADVKVNDVKPQLPKGDGAPQMASKVQIISAEGKAVDPSVAKGGGLSVNNGKPSLTNPMMANANPFNTNSDVLVLDGGVKVASVAPSPKTATDAKVGVGIVDAAPSVKIALQKGVELTMISAPSGQGGSVGGSEPKVSAKLDGNDANTFSFTVKEVTSHVLKVKDAVDASATTVSGQALPSWLKFDKTTQTFLATNPPAGALPLTTKVNLTTKDGKVSSMVVEISK